MKLLEEDGFMDDKRLAGRLIKRLEESYLPALLKTYPKEVTQEEVYNQLAMIEVIKYLSWKDCEESYGKIKDALKAQITSTIITKIADGSLVFPEEYDNDGKPKAEQDPREAALIQEYGEEKGSMLFHQLRKSEALGRKAEYANSLIEERYNIAKPFISRPAATYTTVAYGSDGKPVLQERKFDHTWLEGYENGLLNNAEAGFGKEYWENFALTRAAEEEGDSNLDLKLKRGRELSISRGAWIACTKSGNAQAYETAMGELYESGIMEGLKNYYRESEKLLMIHEAKAASYEDLLKQMFERRQQKTAAFLQLLAPR